MQGVTTAIVAFIFVCMAMPKLVKHRPQFYFAFVAVLLVILIDTLAHIFGGPPDPEAAASTFRGLAKFSYVATGFLQIAAIIFLMLAAGGLSASELAGEIAGAYEVVRRGSNEKEIIIPREQAMAEAAAARAAQAAAAQHTPPPPGEHKVYTIDEAGNEVPTPEKKDDGEKGIPLA